MNILLISPPLNHNIIKRISPRLPPYLLLSSAAQLEWAGFKVNVCDAFAEGLLTGDIIKKIPLSHPDLVGVCFADVTRFSPVSVGIDLIESLKLKFPDVPVVVFGIKNESIIKNLKENCSKIDYIILGDPEEVIVKLAVGLKRKESACQFPWLINKNSNYDNTSSLYPAVVSDLNSLRFPAWHLIDLKRYYIFPHRYKFTEVYPIWSTRGCPWNNCTFCKEASVANSLPFRVRSPQNVVSEIEIAIKINKDVEIQFCDSNFNTDSRWLNKFQEEIKKRSLKFSWSCLSRVDKINEEAVKIMHQTGCWNIVFGIESSSQRLLDTINKGCNVEQMINAVTLCKREGIEITGNFLLGLPGEKPEDVINSANFAVKIGIDYAAFFIAKWHNDHKEFKSEGKFLPEWDYSQFDFTGPVFIPNKYRDLEHLKKVQRKAYLIFYLNPRIILKHLNRLNSCNDLIRLLLGVKTIFKIAFSRIKIRNITAS